MFVAWAIPIGILAGLAAGGRIEHLSSLRLRLGWLAVGGLLLQVVLFSLPLPAELETAGRVAYVASTAAVLVALLANLRITGLPLVALGALANLAAVVANGGVMPTTPAALAAAGIDPAANFSNSAVLAEPALAPLTDVYALPAGLPMANVFSVGDVLIAVGVAVAIAWSMRRPPLAQPA